MASVPHLLRSYDLTPRSAATRAAIQALVSQKISVGTARFQMGVTTGALVLFIMDDVSPEAIQSLEASFAAYPKAG